MTETIRPPANDIAHRIAQIKAQLILVTPEAAMILAKELAILQDLTDCQPPSNNDTMES